MKNKKIVSMKSSVMHDSNLSPKCYLMSVLMTNKKAFFILCNHLFIHSKWAKHNIIGNGNGWVWFGLTILIWFWMKGRTDSHFTKFTKSQPKMLPHECSDWQKAFVFCNHLFIHSKRVKHNIIGNMVVSGLAPASCFCSGWRADILENPSQISAQNATSWVSWPTKKF